VHDNRAILENRIIRELNERILPAETRLRMELPVTAWHAPGEPVSLTEAAAAVHEPVAAGTPWGPPWGTTWFRIDAELPEELPPGRAELLVELGYGAMPGFSAEGTLWVDGVVVAGLHPRRRGVSLDLVTRKGRIRADVEAAANPDFTAGFSPSPMGSRSTAGDTPQYVFGGAYLVVLDDEVHDLVLDIRALDGVMRTLPVEHPRRKRLQHLFQRAYDRLDLDHVGATAAAARAELAPGLALGSAPGTHRISAIGHAHLDTAWLWPLRETRRKAARTFANAVDLMSERPDYRFACSQAVQYSWIEADHPELFERVRRAVADGQWVPVGGMWVEADMNLPSGESLVRQLVHGQRFFEQRFGRRCEEVWIPDVFGYPGSLPQIYLGAGCRRFVTQKLSWNKQNQLPHHSFWWEGIDGSRVMAHFPPVDTYNAEIAPNELAHAVRSFRDHYWSDHSLMPFGYGNGGGGPTREMLDRVDRLGDLAEMPRVVIESPSEFFEHVEAEAATSPVPVWRGELYFETHRGTLTSQARTKVANRRCEGALRAAELWLATAEDDTHAAELDELWKTLLLHQFHDVLPGSSIGWVYEDAQADLRRVLTEADDLAMSAVGGLGDGLLVANAATQDRDEIIAVDPDLLEAAGLPSGGSVQVGTQMLASSEVAMRVRVPGLGVARLEPLEVPEPVTASMGHLSNGLVEIHFDHRGEMVSLRDCVRNRELIPQGCAGAQLVLAADHPVEFDAWDLEQWTGRLAAPMPLADTIGLVDTGPLVGGVRTAWQFGRGSILTRDVVLRAGSPRVDVRVSVEWRESERYLALDLPLAVHAETAACEIQFGLQRRPTHTNTSWDDAKFEICAHRYVDLSEGDAGVAVLNDGRYGHSLHPGPDTPPGSTRVRVSLLRAPRFPDPEADHGLHQVTISLLPHGSGLHDVLAEAEALNTPLLVVPGCGAGDPPAPLVRVGDPRVQVAAVKLADDGSGDLVVRLWEATGSHVDTTIEVDGHRREARRCNLLEEPEEGLAAIAVEHGGLSLMLVPFELVTLRLR
jgi:alpha-mannosidase